MNGAEKKFLRMLLRVLEKVFVDDDLTAILDESESDLEAETKTKKYDVEGSHAHKKTTQHALGQATIVNVKADLRGATKIGDRFKKICEIHGQLTYQIQGSLNALGGGARTAKALERMHMGVTQTAGLFYRNSSTYKDGYLRPQECINALNSCKNATLEVAEAFRELGIFDSNFFDILKSITKRLEATAKRLDVEYGSHFSCRVEQYMDYVFEPLIEDFDAFIAGLTYIAEKEIATIRNTQDFSSQRYLNLTTVATFLSSVTATTLQITTSNPSSTLTSVANSLWLISLVFSTASAVYSLLVMTWRQSSIRQPDVSLPSFLKPWFRVGPMYTLSAAVTTFSIGLCLLAFHVASQQQGGLASAIVPTAFAGIHAYTIFLFSACFLMEKWKVGHAESWGKVHAVYLTLAKKVDFHVDRFKKYSRELQESPRKIKGCGRRILQHLARPFQSFNNQATSLRWHAVAPTVVEERGVSDIESGRDASPAPVVVVSDEPGVALPEQASDADFTGEAAEPGNAFTNPEAVPLPESDMNTNMTGDIILGGEAKNTYKPFENILQFSPNGRFLATAFSDTVTVYTTDSFSMYRTIKTPDANRVMQVQWNPYGFRGELLVRSLGGISVWDIIFSQAQNGHLLGHLKESVVSVNWTRLGDFGIIGARFVCVSDCTIRLFNMKCEEVRSIDLSKMRQMHRITQAVFFRKKYIICLANVPDDSDHDCLLVVNWKENSADSEQRILRGHTSMVVSSEAKMIIFEGRKDGVQVAEILTSGSGDNFTMSINTAYNKLWKLTDRGLSTPEAAVMFHGKNDGLIVGYSSGQVLVKYRKPNDEGLSALHIFTTPTADAVLRNPVSFAVNKGKYSEPYMFAFGDDQGIVKVWSVQSNRELSKLEEVRVFEVHDRRDGPLNKRTITTGSFLTLLPGRFHEVDDPTVSHPLSEVP